MASAYNNRKDWLDSDRNNDATIPSITADKITVSSAEDQTIQTTSTGGLITIRADTGGGQLRFFSGTQGEDHDSTGQYNFDSSRTGTGFLVNCSDAGGAIQFTAGSSGSVLIQTGSGGLRNEGDIILRNDDAIIGKDTLSANKVLIKKATDDNVEISEDGEHVVIKGASTILFINGTLRHQGASCGFYNTAPIAKPTVTGAKGGNAALTSLLTELSNLGLITDSTT